MLEQESLQQIENAMSFRRCLRLALGLLLLSMLGTPVHAEDKLMIYTETAAFVNWINVAPDVELTPEQTPESFTAVVRDPGKLRGFGLPVKLADSVRITLVGPYVWRVEQGADSVEINTRNKIHFSYYPKFQ